MIANRSAPSGTIVPSLIYSDVARAVDYLCDVFGFTERLRAFSENGTVTHAQLAIGEGGVMLGASRKGQGFAAPTAPDNAEFRPPRPDEVNQTLMVRVEDVDGHYEHAQQRGAKILQAPATHPYGERQYTAVDPEGHRWTFSQSVRDVKPEEWGAQVAHLA